MSLAITSDSDRGKPGITSATGRAVISIEQCHCIHRRLATAVS